MKRTIAITLLFAVFCNASFAVIFMMLDAPQDDSQARRDVWDRSELQPLNAAYQDIVATRFFPLKLDDVAKIFGPTLDKTPGDMVLPLFAGNGLGLSGLGKGGPSDKSHTDFHAVGDIGYVECFYQVNGTNIETTVFYFRTDNKFVPLTSVDIFPKRLAWDKAKFAAMKQWFDEHMPKITDLGVVKLLASGPTRVDLGAGTACIVRTRDIRRPNVPFWFSMDLSKDTTNSDERFNSMEWRSVDRTNEAIGFSIDGKYYRLIPKFVEQLPGSNN
jgi:hypothetical protein